MARTNFRVALLSPPVGHQLVAPPLAPAALKAYLKAKKDGIELVQKDLTVISVNYLLSRENLREHGFSEGEIQRAEYALSAMRDMPTYRNFPVFHSAKATLENALEKLNGNNEERLTLRGNTLTYTSKFPYKRRDGILMACQDENLSQNIFYRFYQDKLIPFLIRQEPDLVGLTIFNAHQLIPAFVLSRLLKSAFPEVKIVVGGSYLSRLVNPATGSGVICQDDGPNRRLFDIIDYIIVYEGEMPLLHLTENLIAGTKQEVSKLIQKREGKIESTVAFRSSDILDLNELPCPDFDGLFTDLDGCEAHWAPKRIIPLMPIRGCIWRCRFCSNDNNADNKAYGGHEGVKRYRERRVDLLVQDMRWLKSRHGTQYFSICSSDLHKDYLDRLSEGLSNAGVIWEAFVKMGDFLTDGKVDAALIKRIAKSGCRYLQIGVETVDHNTLMTMRKGNPSTAVVSEVLRETSEAGIMNHLFIFVGYPRPELDDFSYFYSNVRNIEFLDSNQEYFISAKVTRLIVPVDLPDFADYVERKAVLLKRTANSELLLYYPYAKRFRQHLLDEAIADLIDHYIHCVHPANTVSHDLIGPQRIFLTRDEFWENVRLAGEEKIATHYPDESDEILSRLLWELERKSRRQSQGVPAAHSSMDSLQDIRQKAEFVRILAALGLNPNKPS